jgi:RNA recognition motif-containing protein
VTIYVGNLSYQAAKDDLTSVFSDYGTVKRVQLPTDQETGRVREDDAQEEAAIAALNEAEWMGRTLRVNKAKPRAERSNDRPRGRGYA